MEPTNQEEKQHEAGTEGTQGRAKLSQVIQIDEGKIQEHLGEVVRSTVEETLNAMLDAEADRFCRAERYELTEARKDTRAVGAFPDGKSALMLAAARLRHVAGTKWGTRRYLDMNRLVSRSVAPQSAQCRQRSRRSGHPLRLWPYVSPGVPYLGAFLSIPSSAVATPVDTNSANLTHNIHGSFHPTSMGRSNPFNESEDSFGYRIQRVDWLGSSRTF